MSAKSNNSFFKNVYCVANKELWSLFSSPIAVLFVGTFLLSSLFSFFWIEKFFASNIASMRGFFTWMPALLIPLCSAITMRMWSEEKQSGNLEFLLTMPTSEWSLVFGKFTACITLAKLSILLTAPLAISVYLFAEVEGATLIVSYISSFFLAGVYIAIGLYVSSKTENQIVSFLVSTITCTFIYLIGTQSLTSLFNVSQVEILEKFSTSARFESITRGILDFADIYYFLSITFIFLILNVLSLRKARWSKNSNYKEAYAFFILLVSNLLISNFLVDKISNTRVDLTNDRLYSLSEATENTVSLLSEPLYIYSYFSAKTHPLLSPLVPRLKDLINEYEVSSNGKIIAKIIDPREYPKEEKEANTRFGVKPIPFQLSDKYQASLINSYFNIVISYGDQFEVLGLEDLLDISQSEAGGVDVQLKNPEYDITRAIKKAVYSFQNVDNLFSSLSNPIVFTAYVSADPKLPEQLREFSSSLDKVVKDFKEVAGSNLEYRKIDPGDLNSKEGQRIYQAYGFRPMTTSLFSEDKFYFYMLLEGGNKKFQLPLPGELKEEALKQALSQAFKRFSSSFTKTVGIWTPKPKQANSFAPTPLSYQVLRQLISQTHNTVDINLESGEIASNIDLALILEPKKLTEADIFALDQYLMKGATLIVATSPFEINRTQTNLSLTEIDSGLSKWLEHYGISIENKLVMDTNNTPFPIPVVKDLGSFKVNQIELIPYPFFVTASKGNDNQLSAVWGGLSNLNLAWSSPIKYSEKFKNLSYNTIISSSKDSWLKTDTDIQPNFNTYPDLGFATRNTRQSYTLASGLIGEFSSYYKGKELDFLYPEKEENVGDKPEVQENETNPVSVIEKSPESSRLIVLSSNEFLADTTLQLMASTGNSTYENSLTFIQNLIDWSIDDPTLAQIRGRSLNQKTLPFISRDRQQIFECLNYFYAVLGIVVLVFFSKVLWRRKKSFYQKLIS